MIVNVSPVMSKRFKKKTTNKIKLNTEPKTIFKTKKYNTYPFPPKVVENTPIAHGQIKNISVGLVKHLNRQKLDLVKKDYFPETSYRKET